MGSADDAPRTCGRYTLHGVIASGGMATVYLGRLGGAAGFTRAVAIKRMLPRFARDPHFVAMFMDEAALASRIHHPNVVPILDVVAEDGEIFIVMELVRGQSLVRLLSSAGEGGELVPVPIAVAIIVGVLAGLHAAHEARDKRGQLLDIVHRDVTPHNILVGTDGVARIMDFGVAKASSQLHVTQEGQIKGKLAYMAPEQLTGGLRGIDRRADVFAAGVVAWGMLAGRRLFRGADVTDTMDQVLSGPIPPLSEFRDDVPAELEQALRRALDRDRDLRWSTARELEAALLASIPKVAPLHAVGAWVERLAADAIADAGWRLHALEETEATPAAAVEPPRPAAALLPEDEAPTREVGAPISGEPASRASATPAEPAPDAPSRAALSADGLAGEVPGLATGRAAAVVALLITAAVIGVFAFAGSRRRDLDAAEAPAATSAPQAAPPGASAAATTAPADVTVPAEATVRAEASAAPPLSSAVDLAPSGPAGSSARPLGTPAASSGPARPAEPRRAGEAKAGARPTSTAAGAPGYFPERP